MEYVIDQKTNVTVYAPESEYVAFVAKVQKARTRKGKDYYVYRVTIPKDKAEQIGVKPGDFLLLQAKVAQWYHMINWDEMEQTWKMLPEEIKRDVILSGLPTPALPSMFGTPGQEAQFSPTSAVGQVAVPVTVINRR